MDLAGAVISLAVGVAALAAGGPADRPDAGVCGRPARSRDEPRSRADGINVDELRALDRSLLRMAGQTRVLVERAKVESARREAILASMAEGVLAVDEQLRVTFCNQALARLAGTRMPSSGMPLDGADPRHYSARDAQRGGPHGRAGQEATCRFPRPTGDHSSCRPRRWFPVKARGQTRSDRDSARYHRSGAAGKCPQGFRGQRVA